MLDHHQYPKPDSSFSYSSPPLPPTPLPAVAGGGRRVRTFCLRTGSYPLRAGQDRSKKTQDDWTSNKFWKMSRQSLNMAATRRQDGSPEGYFCATSTRILHFRQNIGNITSDSLHTAFGPYLGASSGPLWGYLGLLEASVGLSWASWRPPESLLEASWAPCSPT